MKMETICIDNFEIVEQQIPKKFIKIENEEVGLIEFINTIEQVLETVPNSDIFGLKDYEVFDYESIQLLLKMDYVVKKYGELQSIIYVLKNKEKETQLSHLYDKLCTIIE